MAKPIISFETEQSVLERQQNLCAECGTSLIDTSYYVNFVLPWYLSTPDNPYIVSTNNLVVLCGNCFNLKGAGIDKVKVGFALENEINTWLPKSSKLQYEWLWAKPVGDHKFELQNIPIYILNVSLGDVVQAIPNQKGELIFSKVLDRSGNSSVLISFAGSTINLTEFNSLRKKLYDLGCLEEKWDEKLVAYSIPSSANYHNVVEIFNEGGELGVWYVQEMCNQHENA